MLFISSLPAEIFAEILNEHSTSDLWAWRNSILGLELVWASSRADGSHCTFTESCFFKCLVMPWELWPPGQTGSIPSEGTGMFFYFFSINVLSMTKRKFVSAWKRQNVWMRSTSQPYCSNSECLFWERGTRIHIWVCVSSVNEGHEPKESSAGHQSSEHFRLLFCYCTWLSWEGEG